MSFSSIAAQITLGDRAFWLNPALQRWSYIEYATLSGNHLRTLRHET